MSDARQYVIVAEMGSRPLRLIHVMELQDDVPADANGFAEKYCQGRFRATEQLERQYPGSYVSHHYSPEESTRLTPGATIDGLQVAEDCVMETRRASEFLS